MGAIRALLLAASQNKWLRERSSRYAFVRKSVSRFMPGETLQRYRKLVADYPNAGICLQAYLHRTAHDVDSLLPLKPSIRLVKGAYSEPSSVAITTRERIDETYLTLAQKLLRTQKSGAVRRAAFATHDPSLIRKITEFAD